MTTSSPSPSPDLPSEARDIADVPAAEVISAAAVHLISAAAVNCGLAEEGRELQVLD